VFIDEGQPFSTAIFEAPDDTISVNICIAPAHVKNNSKF
jgi:hypothetical protein